jgi:hypothetical protein
VDDVFVGLGVSLLIIDIPTECSKQWVEKFTAGLSLVVILGLVGVGVAGVALD